MTAFISPPPRLQFFTNAGVPMASGLLYTYAAGTTTPLVTYTDSTGLVANTNPVILDSRGEASIWLSTVGYKFKLATPANVDVWTQDNVSNDVSSANMIYTPAGTGAVTTTVQTKLRESVSVKDFGAVGDGVADDTAAIQAALTSVTGGGSVYFPSGKYYIASSITVPAQVSMVGPLESVGSARYAAFDYTAVKGSLYLSNSASIILSSGSSVLNFLIVNKNLVNAYPFATQAAALAAIAAFAGTAISGTTAEDVYLHNLRILGFAQAIYTTYCDRTKIEWVDIDCKAGIWIDYAYDISRIHDVHAWPFATYGYSFSTTNLVYFRSGSAFKATGHFDGCTITDSFSYGYQTGFDMQAPASPTLTNCWVEGGGASYIAGQYGFAFTGSTLGSAAMIGCGVDTCDTGIYVNCAASKILIQGCQIYANVNGIQVVTAVSVNISNNLFVYPSTTSMGGSPNFYLAGNAAVWINGTTGNTKLTDNWVYGGIGATPTSYGFQFTGTGNYQTVSNNQFLYCTVGIQYDAGCSGPQAILGNVFNLCTTSMVMPTVVQQTSNIGSNVNPGNIGNTFNASFGTASAADYFAFSAAGGPRFKSYYARGSAAVPTTSLINDVTGAYYFYAHDGTNFIPTALIRSAVRSVPSAGNVPGDVIVSVNRGSSSVTDAFSFNTVGLYPLTDNSYKLGASGFRWSEVWAANATIQTSDANAKTDIIPALLGLDFINALQPVSYKFKVGSNKIIRQEYLDEDGNVIPEGDELPGNAVAGQIITEPVAGKRTHWGLLAQQVKSAVPDGVDFGGWIKTDMNDPNSEEGLRYDEFIAPLIKAIQELTARLAVLESKVP